MPFGKERRQRMTQLLTDDDARCMTCGLIGSVSLQPDGNRHSFHCRACGHVVLVSPPYEHAVRFRAFAEDGSRRPANV